MQMNSEFSSMGRDLSTTTLTKSIVVYAVVLGVAATIANIDAKPKSSPSRSWKSYLLVEIKSGDEATPQNGRHSKF